MEFFNAEAFPWIGLATATVILTAWSCPQLVFCSQVKQYIADKYGISVDTQQWAGWASHVTDEMSLDMCNLTQPTHTLTVCLHSSGSSQPSITGSGTTVGSYEAPYVISESDSDHDYEMDMDNDVEMVSQPAGKTRTQLSECR